LNRWAQYCFIILLFSHNSQDKSSKLSYNTCPHSQDKRLSIIFLHCRCISLAMIRLQESLRHMLSFKLKTKHSLHTFMNVYYVDYVEFSYIHSWFTYLCNPLWLSAVINELLLILYSFRVHKIEGLVHVLRLLMSSCGTEDIGHYHIVWNFHQNIIQSNKFKYSTCNLLEIQVTRFPNL